MITHHSMRRAVKRAEIPYKARNAPDPCLTHGRYQFLKGGRGVTGFTSRPRFYDSQ